MTSNIGGELKSEGLGFQPADQADRTLDALRQRFAPEFLGRLDDVICFNKLQNADMERIAQKYLNQLKDRVSKNGILLNLPEKLAAFIGAAGTLRGGARNLRKLVQQRVETPLASFLLTCSKKPSKIRCTIENEEVRFF